MKKAIFSLAVIFSLVLTSCSVTLPVAVSSNPVGPKKGESSGTCYLGVICLDANASIQQAAKNGGITKISTVDIKTSNVLGIIVTYTCIVTGE